MRIQVYELQLDDANADEAAGHGVSESEIRQVLDEAPVFKPNKKGHSATVVMIGPTFGGRLLTVPLRSTALDGIWRPATAWDSSAGERTYYNVARSHRSNR